MPTTNLPRTRKEAFYPRTLQEAFGPYTSNKIEEHDDQEWFDWLIGIIGVYGIVMNLALDYLNLPV